MMTPREKAELDRYITREDLSQEDEELDESLDELPDLEPDEDDLLEDEKEK